MGIDASSFSKMVKGMVNRAGYSKIASNLKVNGGFDGLAQSTLSKYANKQFAKNANNISKSLGANKITQEMADVLDDTLLHRTDMLEKAANFIGSGKAENSAGILRENMGNIRGTVAPVGEYFFGGTGAQTATRLGALGAGIGVTGAIGAGVYSGVNGLTRKETDAKPY